MVGQTHSGARLIKAPPAAIYRAYLEPEAVAVWRPPEGMSAKVYAFDACEGGFYRMSFFYEAASGKGHGKTGMDEDAFTGRFVRLVPDQLIVEEIDFVSDDPAFAGTMTITTRLTPLAEGTQVDIICTDVPAGISQRDHEEGIASTLANLARFTEPSEA